MSDSSEPLALAVKWFTNKSESIVSQENRNFNFNLHCEFFKIIPWHADIKTDPSKEYVPQKALDRNFSTIEQLVGKNLKVNKSHDYKTLTFK